MSSLALKVKEFLVQEDGPTATEYAVMLALIIVVSIGAISSLGETVNSIFQGVGNGLAEGGG